MSAEKTEDIAATSLFELYSLNRAQGVANHITSDLSLVAYSLIRQKSILALENTRISPLLVDLLDGMGEGLEGMADSMAKLQDDDLAKQAHVANQQYIAVLRSLLSGEPVAGLSTTSRNEFDRIVAAVEVMESPMWGRAVDYTQFKPRGRYTSGAEAEQFFRTLRYAGAQFFAIQPSASTGLTEQECDLQTAQILQLISLINRDETLKKQRDELETSLQWQFGQPDDLTDDDIVQALGNFDDDIVPNDAKAKLLQYARQTDRQPRIVDAIVDLSLLESDISIADAVTGWRFLPSRYSVQVASQQALIFDQTGPYTGDATQLPFGYGVVGGQAVKAFPAALEWLSLLGYTKSDLRLTESQESAFTGYDQAFSNAQALVSNLNGSALLHAEILRAGFSDVTTISSTDKLRHDSQSLLAFQTWQRFLNVLYTKQSYSPISKGQFIPTTSRQTADLDVATPLYLALGHAARQQFANTGLGQWREFSTLMDRMTELSSKRGNNSSLSASDISFLNGFDLALSKLTGSADMPVVVDVHTEPDSGQVAQQATGLPRVFTQTDVQGEMLRGARLSFTEFKHPMSDRLTLEVWQSSLYGDEIKQ